MKANGSIRKKIENNRLKYWEVAYEIGISDGRFSVWLRTPLNDERKLKVVKAIDSLIAKEKAR